MKYLFAFLALTLVACSGAQTAPEQPTEATDATLNSDPLLAQEETPLPAPEGTLATPVDAVAQPEPPPSLPEPTPAEPVAAEEHAPEAPPVAEAPKPALPSATPAQVPAPPVVSGGTRPDRNVRQEYREYQDRAAARSQAEEEIEDRSLFAHEDGAFQIGLDYALSAYPNRDFDPTRAKKQINTKGGQISWTYFPVRSLNFGRLGASLVGGMYWSQVDPARNKYQRSIHTLGAKASYEFQYWIGQLLVPHIFYGYEKNSGHAFTSRGISYPKTSFYTQLYGGGVNLNLNRLEKAAASKALASSGIRKFYLSYTFSQDQKTASSNHYLGLRFEY